MEPVTRSSGLRSQGHEWVGNGKRVPLYCWGWEHKDIDYGNRESLDQLCVYVRVHNCTWGVSNRSGISTWQTDCLSPAADLPCTQAFVLPLMDLHPAQPERRELWGHWCCLCLYDWSGCLSVGCVASHVCMYVCIYVCIYLFIYIHKCGVYLCVLLLGTHIQPCYCLDLGTWSCNSLASLVLMDPTQCIFPDRYPHSICTHVLQTETFYMVQHDIRMRSR